MINGFPLFGPKQCQGFIQAVLFSRNGPFDLQVSIYFEPIICVLVQGDNKNWINILKILDINSNTDQIFTLALYI